MIGRDSASKLQRRTTQSAGGAAEAATLESFRLRRRRFWQVPRAGLFFMKILTNHARRKKFKDGKARFGRRCRREGVALIGC